MVELAKDCKYQHEESKSQLYGSHVLIPSPSGNVHSPNLTWTLMESPTKRIEVLSRPLSTSS